MSTSSILDAGCALFPGRPAVFVKHPALRIAVIQADGFSVLSCETPSQSGAEDGIRTRDLLITNQLLYQLSYLGIFTA